MLEYLLTMLSAAAVTYLLTPLVRRFAIAVGAMHAARDRDVHVVPTPLLGGFAMYAGIIAGLLVASRLSGLNSAFEETNMAKGLLLAGGLIVVMGFVDDRWGMGALSKLAGQVAAAVVLVWSGAEVIWLPSPNGGTLGLTSDQQVAVTILVVVVTINAVNFIDGLDGLAAGIVGIGAAAFFIYYYTLTHRLGLPDQTGPALASAVLAGVCLGFLPHNFHPARIFMGDTGSMLIGLLLAYAPISSLASLDPGSLTDYANGTVNRFGELLPLLLPAAIMLIPYSDLLLAVVRRTRAGMSPFAPDRQHLHHRLLAIGHSHRASVLIMYLWATLFAGSVVWLSIVRTPLFVLAIVTVAAMLALLLVSMPRLRVWSRPESRDATLAIPAVTAASASPANLATPAPVTGPALVTGLAVPATTTAAALPDGFLPTPSEYAGTPSPPPSVPPSVAWSSPSPPGGAPPSAASQVPVVPAGPSPQWPPVPAAPPAERPSALQATPASPERSARGAPTAPRAWASSLTDSNGHRAQDAGPSTGPAPVAGSLRVPGRVDAPGLDDGPGAAEPGVSPRLPGLGDRHGAGTEPKTSPWLSGIGDEPGTEPGSGAGAASWLPGLGDGPGPVTEPGPEPGVSPRLPGLGDRHGAGTEPKTSPWLSGIGDEPGTEPGSGAGAASWLPGPDAGPDSGPERSWFSGLGDGAMAGSPWSAGTGGQPTRPGPSTGSWLFGPGDPADQDARPDTRPATGEFPPGGPRRGDPAGRRTFRGGSPDRGPSRARPYTAS